MTLEDYSLPSVFQHYLESEKSESSSGKIAEFIASGNLSRVSFEQLLEKEGVKDARQLKEVLLDQVLFYAKTCVQDHELTDDEQNNLLLLNILFRIEEGDFLQLRKRVIQNILSTQISQTLQDRLIIKSEEILLANLQRIFGLSTSQYANLIQPSIEAHIKELEVWKANSQSSTEKEQIETCIRNLRSIY
jgi:hypothetical protein